MDYLYDGSFDGLLTAIYFSYYEEKADGIYPADNYQYSLLTVSKQVTTEPELAAKVYDAVERKISPQALRRIYYVYLANHPQKENLILRYLQLGFKLGPEVDSYHTHPAVLPVRELAKKVSFEAHRFYGLLRFIDAGNYLYAVLEPDHNILILLADHFADRLKQENSIIHDKKRNLAIIYNRKDWYLTDFPKDIQIPISAKEAFFQDLWAKYFMQIGIENRKNKRLQDHFVPQRYRHNLVEFTKSYAPPSFFTPGNKGTKRQ
ncbi:MAG TPA: DNA metabolism protein [Peptococcaceae bacterium]|nr:DNA metabolism protein [Peptococcaceae bacterium]